ncbi:predicted protein [Chaetoceros tenuissimus]|uniref:Uncharacterized protein n=1 Tax=Chaetoceros tenuissimus TaxID=426638 RepID=A0AAD3D8C7_9STRA|nr:predicted protein [Chaetoceros tenuissimus]
MAEQRSRHQKALEELEIELKIVQWHIVANDNALQAALLREKTIKQEDARMKPRLEEAKRAEKRERLKTAREDEEKKSLQLSYDERILLEKEDSKVASLDMDRRERASKMVLESKEMIHERMQIKSRREYTRSVRTARSSKPTSGSNSPKKAFTPADFDNFIPIETKESKTALEKLEEIRKDVVKQRNCRE